MTINAIYIKNYRVFRDAQFLGLPPLSVVIGANGTGKSTLFDVFSFLKDALVGNVHSATVKRCGFSELRSRGRRGPIEISVYYVGSGERDLYYSLYLSDAKGRTIVENEILISSPDDQVRGGQIHGEEEKFVDFVRGRGFAFRFPEGESEGEQMPFELDDASTLAIKALGQIRDFPLVIELRSLIESWYISNFHIADARVSAEAGYAEHLSTLGDNVAQVAHYLHENHPRQFRKVLEAMRDRVPGVDEVEAKVTEDGRLVLRFKDGSFKDPFIARHVSDGTIKMFAYLVLLHDPKPHPLIAVEEPENQLYPDMLGLLIEEFRDYARRGGQAFVSTHSPDLLNGANLDEVYWLEKVKGFSRVRRASDNPLLRDLYDAGDPPGALWKRRLFDGVDP